MHSASALLTRAAACHHPPPNFIFWEIERETWFQTLSCWFHLSCITFNPETAPVHRGAHGPLKLNGQHHLQAVRRKQLPQVKVLKHLWGLFTRADKRDHEAEQQLGASAADSKSKTLNLLINQQSNPCEIFQTAPVKSEWTQKSTYLQKYLFYTPKLWGLE